MAAVPDGLTFTVFFAGQSPFSLGRVMLVGHNSCYLRENEGGLISVIVRAAQE